MIEFCDIKYKNLLASGNYWTEIKLNENQNTLIIGGNGSGKSTVLDAICLALFGKAFRNINKPALLNSINQKDCVVEVNFKTNGKSYKVVRGIKPNIFEIYQDGILLNQEASSKDYQEILEKTILKFNFKSFTQIVILGSASFVPFMQLSSTDRRTIIEDLLDIQIFSTMNNIIKDKISNNKDLIVEKKNSIELIQQKYNLEKKHLDSLQQDNEGKIIEYQTEIETSNDTVTKLIEENEHFLTVCEGLQVKIDQKIDSENKIKKLTKIESTVESKVSKHKSDITFFQHNDNCPTCRQTIDSTFKEAELGKLQSEVNEFTDGLKKLELKLLEEQEIINEIVDKQKQFQKIQIKVASNNTAIKETNRYITKINGQIEGIKNRKIVNECDEIVLTELSGQLDTLKFDLKELIDEKVYYDTAITLLKDSGIKTKIVKQYLPIINKLVNKYLTALDFFVNFNLDESFKETIKSRHRDDFTYNNFSEGEKTRIDMSLMLAWRAVAKLKNSTNTNLLFLDEIFDSSLDATGADYLMNILHILEDVNLFVISHRGDILQDKFANIIKFDKVKNFSRMTK
jgi:DNA repair exonuclease SbcCD ATPase subunit